MSLVSFLREVKVEVKRVSWPNANEVGVIALLVLAMVVLFSLFFLMVDSLIYKCIQFIVNF